MLSRILTAPLLLSAVSAALPSYTGYSGAPGTSGTCASSCHGTSGGTIVVTGFPAEYTPGQSYLVSVTHTGGSSISNFNASVRTGTTSRTAGTLAAGYRTATYSRPNEPDGVHLSSNGRDSCTFTWTAPDTGVGDVKLYFAGMQGSSRSGQNSTLVLTASLMTGVTDRPVPAGRGLGLSIHPSIVTRRATIRLSLPPGARPMVYVTDQQGRVVSRIPAAQTNHAHQTIIWRPAGRSGSRLAAGVYLITLRCGADRLIRKLIVR